MREALPPRVCTLEPGAVATFDLPVAGQESKVVSASTVAACGLAAMRPPHVLVVEDNAMCWKVRASPVSSFQEPPPSPPLPPGPRGPDWSRSTGPMVLS